MARRRQGTGTVRKRSDGRWEGRLSTGYGKTRSVYGKTMREVQQKLRELERHQEQGVDLNAPPQTVEQFLQTWLELTVKENYRPKTYKSYEQIVRCHLLVHLGKIRLDELRPDMIRKMLQALREKECSERTRQYVVGVLSRALNQAVNDGLIVRNVARLVKVPQPQKIPRQRFTMHMLNRFLVVLRGNRLEALYHLALSLGLRRGELLALRWDDVDLHHHILSVVKSKTQAGVRNLPLSSRLVTFLHMHRIHQNEERTTQGVNWKEHGLVFPTSVGTPMVPRNLVRHFKSVLVKLINEDIKQIEAATGTTWSKKRKQEYRKKRLRRWIRFHDLRHICASLLVAQGVHQRVVMEILGQSSIKVAMEIYTHINLHQKSTALKTLDDILGGGTEGTMTGDLLDDEENILLGNLPIKEPDNEESDDEDQTSDVR